MKNLPVLAVIILFVLGCGQIEKQNISSQPVSNEPPIVIKAERLAAEYDENELAADAKYKNKRVEVAGKVSDIAEVLGSIQVELEGHKENGINILSARCAFPESEKTAVAKIKKNQTTVLIGTVAGKTMNLYVSLQDCKVK